MSSIESRESVETLQGNTNEMYIRSSEDSMTTSEERTQFLVFFGITCALIGVMYTSGRRCCSDRRCE